MENTDLSIEIFRFVFVDFHYSEFNRLIIYAFLVRTKQNNTAKMCIGFSECEREWENIIREDKKWRLELHLNFWVSDLTGNQESRIELHRWDLRKMKVLIVTSRHFKCIKMRLSYKSSITLKIKRSCTNEESWLEKLQCKYLYK